jgi:hypothetical protein
MKATEAPEKIWMNDDWVHQFDVKEFMGEDSVEYTRTDAFIEKAIGWIDYNNRNGGCFFDGWEKDFRKYMKGE